MKILHILKKAPDECIGKIIELQAAGNQIKTIELFKDGVSYDSLVADIFNHDKVFCW